MGHYQDIKFEAHLNEFGKEVISNLYKYESWNKVVSLYPTVHPSVFAGITDECNPIPFSPSSDLNGAGSQFDEENGIWSCFLMYKWRGNIDNVIHNLLQYLIAKPCDVWEEHDLWDNSRATTIQPKEIKE